jgi:cytochrome c peroxidase
MKQFTAHVLGVTGLVMLTWLNPAGAQTSAGKAPHGAMPMEQQLSRIDQLLPKRDGTQAPPEIRGAIWKTFLPKDNDMTEARVALGRKLYFDPRLSADGSVACATCHDVSRGFTDQRNVSEGIRDQLGRRNAPTTMNAFLMQSQFLDGRSATLEDQAKLPIVNPIEMGHPNGDAAVKGIAGDADYKRMFQDAYGRAPNYDDVGRALAAFERTLVFLDAPFDDFARGNVEALSPAAREGWRLFNERGRCVTCHWINPSNPLGTDNRFHNIGVSARHQDFESLAGRAMAELAKDGGIDNIDQLALSTDMSELGRFMVTKNRADIGGFKTSQIRNIALTGPYMHDGSMQTLWDVVDHYNKGGEANPYLDGGIEPLALSEDEVTALVEFMVALTDKRFAAQGQEELTRQRGIASTKRPFRDEALAMRKKFPFEARLAEKSGVQK